VHDHLSEERSVCRKYAAFPCDCQVYNHTEKLHIAVCGTLRVCD